MCEERIIHTKLNVYLSNLKIDFLLLLSTTFLAVGVAYKTTNIHGFSWYSTFSGQGSNFLWNIKLETTMARSIVPTFNNDSNKTNHR